MDFLPCNFAGRQANPRWRFCKYPTIKTIVSVDQCKDCPLRVNKENKTHKGCNCGKNKGQS